MSQIDELLAAERTAVLCMEMQRGVVGDLADHPAAAAVREAGVVANLASLFVAARNADVPVVHCTASFRADRAGSYRNMPAIERLLDNPDHLLEGTPPCDVIAELWHERDLRSDRHHGISPFTDTALDTLLRSLGRRTVIATGVSLNRGIIGMTIEAVNRGYDVVIPRDGAAGYPTAYADAVLEHTLGAISTITDITSITRVWSA